MKAAKLEIGIRSQESGVRRKEEEGRRKEEEGRSHNKCFYKYEMLPSNLRHPSQNDRTRVHHQSQGDRISALKQILRSNGRSN
ncbi:hypothetical protein [Microcoleus sp. D2_18a_B4]|uniref:hypothetical protein n=1 Tax=Microcoleus sp. D2_18a_B4 TaxID=3055329 RepID=UPI002FD131FB